MSESPVNTNVARDIVDRLDRAFGANGAPHAAISPSDIEYLSRAIAELDATRTERNMARRAAKAVGEEEQVTEPAWIAAVEAELARLNDELGPMPESWDSRQYWWARREAQAEAMNGFLKGLGGSVRKTKAHIWACRIDGRRATSVVSWQGAVQNAIAEERKKVAV